MNNELYHYGVLGMKWGVRRNRGITDSIRDLQRKNANNTLNDVRTKKKQVNGELRELKSYDKNPSKLGSSKISTTIRRSQIKSLTKTQNKLNSKERDAKSALKELDSIEKYQQKKQERKQKIKKVYNDMNKKASIGEKMLYNSATRKKAAKYVVNNNMSVSEAKKKAQGEALKNTAAFLDIYGGAAAYAIHKIK